MRVRCLAFACPLLLASLVAAPLRAEPPSEAAAEPVEPAEAIDEQPPEFPPESTRWKLILGGLGVTAAWYGAAAGASFAFPDAPGARDLRTPIIGPWQAIANNGCPSDEPDCSDALVILRTIVTALDGIGQAAGPLLVLEGIFLPTAGQEPARTPLREPSRPPTTGPGSPPPSSSPPPPPPPSPNDGNKNLFFVRPSSVGLRGLGISLSGQF